MCTQSGSPIVGVRLYGWLNTANPCLAIAILAGSDFKNGVIETEVAGAPLPGASQDMRGFIGIAFRVQPAGSQYECFFLRPTNGRAENQIRRNHSSTNEIETSFSSDKKRRINLDPGYLTLSKVVLASTKNYAHRICLRKGIYGEITLYYQKGRFNPYLFTYRDYQEKSCLDMFMQARALLRKQLPKND